MARRMDAIRPLDQPRTCPLSELEAFIRLDPVLADLNKQFLDAKSNHQKAAQKHGCRDCLTEIAGEREDSAWCAMQTRYIELRRQREMMERAQRMMRQAECDLEEGRIGDGDRESQKRAIVFARAARREPRSPAIFEWILILMILKNSFREAFPGNKPAIAA